MTGKMKQISKKNIYLILRFCDDNNLHTQLNNNQAFNGVGNVFACVLAIQHDNNSFMRLLK